MQSPGERRPPFSEPEGCTWDGGWGVGRQGSLASEIGPCATVLTLYGVRSQISDSNVLK